MLTISSTLERQLPNEPEYRMGYQKVIATLNTGTKELGIILNCQIFFKTDDFSKQFSFADWNSIVNEAKRSSLIVVEAVVKPRDPESLKGVRVVALANEKFSVLANRKSTLATYSTGTDKIRLLQESQQYSILASGAAKDAPITLTDSGEIFKRFSAFSNDRRVTAGKGLTAGTFATTKVDADANIRTGSDAVARYALPNSSPASNVFTITSPKDSELKRGTAEPANNQPGGGVEVIFVNGLPDGTVTGPTTIPDR